jgi:hypothetical protein
MRTRPALRRVIFGLGVALIATPATSLDKEDLLANYKSKFVVVVDDGLSTGFCPGNNGQVATRLSNKIIINIHAVDDVETQNPFGCDVEPAHTR